MERRKVPGGVHSWLVPARAKGKEASRAPPEQRQATADKPTDKTTDAPIDKATDRTIDRSSSAITTSSPASSPSPAKSQSPALSSLSSANHPTSKLVPKSSPSPALTASGAWDTAASPSKQTESLRASASRTRKTSRSTARDELIKPKDLKETVRHNRGGIVHDMVRESDGELQRAKPSVKRKVTLNASTASGAGTSAARSQSEARPSKEAAVPSVKVLPVSTRDKSAPAEKVASEVEAKLVPQNNIRVIVKSPNSGVEPVVAPESEQAVVPAEAYAAPTEKATEGGTEAVTDAATKVCAEVPNFDTMQLTELQESSAPEDVSQPPHSPTSSFSRNALTTGKEEVAPEGPALPSPSSLPSPPPSTLAPSTLAADTSGEDVKIGSSHENISGALRANRAHCLTTLNKLRQKQVHNHGAGDGSECAGCASVYEEVDTMRKVLCAFLDTSNHVVQGLINAGVCANRQLDIVRFHRVFVGDLRAYLRLQSSAPFSDDVGSSETVGSFVTQLQACQHTRDDNSNDDAPAHRPHDENDFHNIHNKKDVRDDRAGLVVGSVDRGNAKRGGPEGSSRQPSGGQVMTEERSQKQRCTSSDCDRKPLTSAGASAEHELQRHMADAAKSPANTGSKESAEAAGERRTSRSITVPRPNSRRSSKPYIPEGNAVGEVPSLPPAVIMTDSGATFRDPARFHKSAQSPTAAPTAASPSAIPRTASAVRNTTAVPSPSTNFPLMNPLYVSAACPGVWHGSSAFRPAQGMSLGSCLGCAMPRAAHTAGDYHAYSRQPLHQPHELNALFASLAGCQPHCPYPQSPHYAHAQYTTPSLHVHSNYPNGPHLPHGSSSFPHAAEPHAYQCGGHSHLYKNDPFLSGQSYSPYHPARPYPGGSYAGVPFNEAVIGCPTSAAGLPLPAVPSAAPHWAPVSGVPPPCLPPACISPAFGVSSVNVQECNGVCDTMARVRSSWAASEAERVLEGEALTTANANPSLPKDVVVREGVHELQNRLVSSVGAPQLGSAFGLPGASVADVNLAASLNIGGSPNIGGCALSPTFLTGSYLPTSFPPNPFAGAHAAPFHPSGHPISGSLLAGSCLPASFQSGCVLARGKAGGKEGRRGRGTKKAGRGGEGGEGGERGERGEGNQSEGYSDEGEEDLQSSSASEHEMPDVADMNERHWRPHARHSVMSNEGNMANFLAQSVASANRQRHILKEVDYMRSCAVAGRVQELKRLLPRYLKSSGEEQALERSLHTSIVFELFRLDDELLNLLVLSLKPMYIKKDHVIYNRGDTGDGAYFVHSGQVDIIVNGHVIRTATPGELFGEVAVLNRSDRAGTAKATTDCHLHFLHRDVYAHLVTISHLKREEACPASLAVHPQMSLPKTQTRY